MFPEIPSSGKIGRGLHLSLLGEFMENKGRFKWDEEKQTLVPIGPNPPKVEKEEPKLYTGQYL